MQAYSQDGFVLGQERLDVSNQPKTGDDDGEVVACDTPACLLEECLRVPEKGERKEKEDVGYTSRREERGGGEKEERRERRGREEGERRSERKEEGEREKRRERRGGREEGERRSEEGKEERGGGEGVTSS